MTTLFIVLIAVSTVTIVAGFALANRGEDAPQFARITGGNVDYRSQRPALPARAQASTMNAIAARSRAAKRAGEEE